MAARQSAGSLSPLARNPLSGIEPTPTRLRNISATPTASKSAFTCSRIPLRDPQEPSRREDADGQRDDPTVQPGKPSQFLERSLKASPRCSLGIEIAGAIHRLQLPASQKDHAWTQTAAISDPMLHWRWVHRIKHPGCALVRNRTSPSPEIPSCVESEIRIRSYADPIVRDRAEDNCTGRGAKAINHDCLA